ncbi:hypothetical protein RGU70_13720 [Herbaspirillum sp. RTI4]|uniref:hypothetical protein n=1 Tax=Herbaspirillum sp. RTI4 TaxID=3048640 RepID=UPI002AB45006|nr:hypothetical protein [Herbaspirillum sp. RTI4]MDY7579372.1 hypothetical protein [Herbaspirillum sp. RTI4]MEA9980286.1 hypothetical protein [Herbaspirillum sp. RTI4]
MLKLVPIQRGAIVVFVASTAPLLIFSLSDGSFATHVEDILERAFWGGNSAYRYVPPFIDGCSKVALISLTVALLYPKVLRMTRWIWGWIMRGSLSKAKRVQSPLVLAFEKEISTWPTHQAKLAVQMIHATLHGTFKPENYEYKALTLYQFRTVLDFIDKAYVHKSAQ